VFCVEKFASTRLGLPIWSFCFGSNTGKTALVLGGVHGNEPEGCVLAHRLCEELSKGSSFSFQTCVIPEFNPEGVFAGSRVNSSGVDLNRNLPTKDWKPEAFDPKYPPGPSANSEPENQALVKWLDIHRPIFVFSLHSFHRYMLNVNGECLPVAEAIGEVNGYPIEESIGYPTPGCLGTYAGLERNFPTITYEIERGLALSEIVKTHVPSLMAGLKKLEEITHG